MSGGFEAIAIGLSVLMHLTWNLIARHQPRDAEPLWWVLLGQLVLVAPPVRRPAPIAYARNLCTLCRNRHNLATTTVVGKFASNTGSLPSVTFPMKGRTVVLGALNLLVALGLGRFLFSMSAPLMHEHFRMSFTRIGVLASLILLGYLSFSYLGGVALHRFRRKSVLTLALACMVVAFLVPAVSSHFGLLCVGFFLVGSAAGTIYMSIFPVVSEFIPDHRYGTYMGMIFTGAGLGIVLISGAVQGALASHAGFHLLWACSAGAAVFALIANGLFFQPSPQDATGTPPPRLYRNAWAVLLRDPFLRAVTVSYFFYGASYASFLTYIFAYIAEAGRTAAGTAGGAGPWLIFGTLSIVSTLAWGWASDRAELRKLLVCNYLLTTMAIGVAVAFRSSSGLMLSLALYSLCFFGYIMVIGGAIVKATGSLSSVFMGKITLIHTIGQVAGALGGGMARDHTGSFTDVFVFSLATLLVSSALFMAAPAGMAPRMQTQ